MSTFLKMHFNLPKIRAKVLTLTHCHDTLAKHFATLAVWQLDTTKSTFKTGFEHDTTRRVQNWSQKLWNCMFTYPKCKSKSVPPPMVRWPKSLGQTCLIPWQFGNLPQPQSTFKTGFGQVTIWWVQKWSQNMCTFIFSYPRSGSKCLLKLQHFLLPPQKKPG